MKRRRDFVMNIYICFMYIDVLSYLVKEVSIHMLRKSVFIKKYMLLVFVVVVVIACSMGKGDIYWF